MKTLKLTSIVLVALLVVTVLTLAFIYVHPACALMLGFATFFTVAANTENKKG